MTEQTLTLAFKPVYKKNKLVERRNVLENRQQLNNFLSSVERRAFRIAQLATSNPDDALEIVQEAMMKLVERYSDRPEEEWTPLFYRILSSKINDWYRKQRTRNKWFSWLPGQSKDDEFIDPIENAPSSSKSPLEELEQSNTTEKMLKLLEALSPRQQQAFLLRAWQGFNTEETAFAMGCTVGSVKTHYSRAIHSLRTQLEAQDS